MKTTKGGIGLLRRILYLLFLIKGISGFAADYEHLAITQTEAVTRMEQFIDVQHPTIKALFEEQEDAFDCRFCDGYMEECFCHKYHERKLSLHKILVEKMLFENRHRTYLTFAKLYEDSLSIQREVDSYEELDEYFEEIEDEILPLPVRRYHISSFPTEKNIDSPRDLYEFVLDEGGNLFDSRQIDVLLNRALFQFKEKYAYEIAEVQKAYQKAFNKKVNEDNLKAVTQAVIELPCCGLQLHRSCLRELHASAHQTCPSCKAPVTDESFKQALRAFVPTYHRKEKCWLCLEEFSQGSEKKRCMPCRSDKLSEEHASFQVKKQRACPS